MGCWIWVLAPQWCSVDLFPGCPWLPATRSRAQQHPAHPWRPSNHSPVICLPSQGPRTFLSKGDPTRVTLSSGQSMKWSRFDWALVTLARAAVCTASVPHGVHCGPAPQARGDVMSRWSQLKGYPSYSPFQQEAIIASYAGEVLVLGQGYHKLLSHASTRGQWYSHGVRNIWEFSHWDSRPSNPHLGLVFIHANNLFSFVLFS